MQVRPLFSKAAQIVVVEIKERENDSLLQLAGLLRAFRLSLRLW